MSVGVTNIKTIDLKIIAFLNRWFLPLARAAIFVVYFYFGILKLLGDSPASPLARSLTEKTIGLSHFSIAFNVLAVFECIIGILFLFPKFTRLVIPLLFLHLVIVCSPLLLVPHLVWAKPLVPTLEGQYILKNLVLAALAIGIAAQTKPLGAGSKRR
jgi:uncharacterized membrane protein YkgB